MVDSETRKPDTQQALRSVARHSLAVLLTTTALGVVSAHAVDGTWVGGNGGDPNEWVEPANWSSAAVPDGIATFTNTGVATVANDNGIVIIGKIQFTTAPNAQAYTININNPFIVNGQGIVNGSTNTQTFNVSSGNALVFQNGSTSNGGTGAVIINNLGGGFINFQNTSSAGSATIVNTGILQFDNTSTAATAQITNNGQMDFFAASNAGNAAITNAAAATLTFNGTATANTATIGNSGTLQFNNASTAGSANITNVATLGFFNSSGAGSATIVNNGGGVISFNDTSTAGNAHITNNGSGLSFNNSSTAGNATITNNGGSFLNFVNSSTAGSASITNGASIQFTNTSTAGNATIINNNAGTTTFGIVVVGTDTATAGNANITNNSGGVTEFTAATSAASATILNKLGGVLQFGDSGAGSSTATAGNSVITNNGNTSFNALTTAGSSTLTTNSGGNVFFFDSSTGGSARFITNAGGSFDMSTLTAAGMTAGSIEGTGSYLLGAKNLAVGSNNLSTTVSGVISGIGGSLTKVGTGTLILSGTNTYTGGTTITGGTLQLGNGGATGSVLGNVLDNGIFAINRSNAYTFGGVISGTGALQQIGSGTTTLTGTNTYAGPTTVSAGTLTISGTGSITSNVMNNATFNNAGTVTGSVTNNGTASNSGTITNGLANMAGTTTNTGTINGGLINNAVVNANGGAINGAIANNAGATFNVAGTVTSNSTFTNAAGGMLAVGTTGNYTLQGLLTNSGAVTVANGGQLIDTVGGITNNVGGTITVAAGGTVMDDLNNAGIVTNNGAYVANVATNTGTITNNGVWTGNVASNTGTITNNLTWTGTVSNAGMFNNNAGATVSGLLTNTAGVATDNGTLAGGAIISGGTLTGAGSVTTLTIANGGTFAPGNGTPGTSMTVTGNLAFQSGGLYLLQLNPATASFTTVAGSATLGGATVKAVFLPGSYVNRQYTIVNATGGVSGTFNPAVTSNMANLQSTLTYDAKDVFLNIKLSFVPPPSGSLNINQQNVANALTNFFNATGSIPAAFAGLNAAGLTIASGELGTGVIQSSIRADDLFLNLLLDPSVAGRAGGFGPVGGPSQFAADDEGSAFPAKRKPSPSERDAYAMVTKAPLLAAVPVSRWSVWGAAYGGSATTQGNAVVGSQDTTARVWGVVAGADYKVSPDTLLGFAVAGGGTSFSLANGLGSGSADLFQAGAFGRHNFGPAYISAALAYGWHDVTTNRTVALAGIDLLQARFRAETFSGRFEGGYRFAMPMIGITPYAAAQVISFNLPAYAEQALAGSALFALNYAAKTTTATRTELGLRSDKSIALQDAVLTLRGRAAWAHDYNPDRAVTAIFQALPGASFVVNGARGNPDAALVSAGAEVKWLNGFSLAATFEGEFSGNTTSYSGKGVARYAW